MRHRKALPAASIPVITLLQAFGHRKEKEVKHPTNFLVRSVRIIVLLGFVLAVSSPSIAAKVKKKTGEVVEGDIKGTVVLWEPDSDGNPAAWAAEGKHVVAIDEKGVRVKSGKCLFVFGRGVRNLSEVLLMVQRLKDRNMGPLEMFQIRLPSGGYVFASFPSKLPTWTSESGGNPIRAKLLGDLRVEKTEQPEENKAPTIVPTLEIQTEKGTVSIPVDDIVENSRQKR